MLSKIMDRLEAWMTEGWNTPTAATPYVNWRYREYNNSADRICNIVMNTETDVFNNTPENHRTTNTHTSSHSQTEDADTKASPTGYAIRTYNTTTNNTCMITTIDRPQPELEP